MSLKNEHLSRLVQLSIDLAAVTSEIESDATGGDGILPISVYLRESFHKLRAAISTARKWAEFEAGLTHAPGGKVTPTWDSDYVLERAEPVLPDAPVQADRERPATHSDADAAEGNSCRFY